MVGDEIIEGFWGCLKKPSFELIESGSGITTENCEDSIAIYI